MKKNSFIIMLILSMTLVVEAQNFSFEKIPSWIKPIEIPENSHASKYEISSGYYLTLADYQINLEEDAIFSHEVTNVVSYSGITNASQLSVIYDTSYQHLKIHHLYIWRKGEKIDYTKNLSFEILSNEYNLNVGLYAGKVTAYEILNDIRKNDLIDFSYTLTGNNPIFENEKYLFIPLETINQIDLYSVRVIYPKDRNYTYQCIGCDSIDFSSTITDNYRQIEIISENIKAIKYEDFIPSWSLPFKYFILSSFKSWKDVNYWAQNVFALDKEPDLEEVFNEIFTGNETTEEKINKIIDYVQDDIRYMGIESGIGSIKPFPPEQVVKQRFGDCKDKSLLLVSLLKKIGIEKTYPVLVNVNMRHELDKLYPSNEIFDHCIVKFEYNDISYWVDPSITLQGGNFKDLSIIDYGKVMVVGLPSDTLQIICPLMAKTGADLIEEMTVTSFTEPAELKIISTRYGFEADTRRAFLEYYTASDLMKQVSDELKLLFPTVNKIGDLNISDDIENNIISVTYGYEVDGFWQDGDNLKNEALRGYWIFKYEPLSLYHYLNKSVCEERVFDYGLNYPLNLNYQVIFHFPKEMLISDDYTTFDNEAFLFDEKIEQLSSNSFQVDYSFSTKSDFIKADRYKNICEQVNAIVKNLPIVIYFSK